MSKEPGILGRALSGMLWRCLLFQLAGNLVGRTRTPDPKFFIRSTRIAMTTSPKVGAAAADAPVGSPVGNVDALILEKRASSVGWYFLELYYGFFNDAVDKIHKLYHPHASLSHAEFPVEGGNRTIHHANGNDAIKKRFGQISPAVNRIVISSADIQVCLLDKILIVAHGQWSRDGSAFWQFNQTFVLCPGKRETSFDLANDVLRFVDYELFQEEGESNEETEMTKAGDYGKENGEKGEKTETAAETAPMAAPMPVITTAPAAEAPEATTGTLAAASAGTESATAQKDTTVLTQPTAEAESESKGTEQDAVAEQEAEHESTETQAAERGPMTWAALAATAKEGKTTTLKPAKKTSPAGSASPTVAAPVTSPTASATGKYKNEDWFPIYVRGIKDVDENTLRDHLSKSFGPVKYLKANMNIALCDFRDAESQRRALNARETVVDGVPILLEVRELKANVKAFKAQKEKGEFKKKTEKKVPKKKRE